MAARDTSLALLTSVVFSQPSVGWRFPPRYSTYWYWWKQNKHNLHIGKEGIRDRAWTSDVNLSHHLITSSSSSSSFFLRIFNTVTFSRNRSNPIHDRPIRDVGTRPSLFIARVAAFRRNLSSSKKQKLGHLNPHPAKKKKPPTTTNERNSHDIGVPRREMWSCRRSVDIDIDIAAAAAPADTKCVR